MDDFCKEFRYLVDDEPPALVMEAVGANLSGSGGS
jgi:hypothetical protein